MKTQDPLKWFQVKIALNLEFENEESKIRSQEGQYEKWKLMNNHIRRESFANNFYVHNNIPTNYPIYMRSNSSEAFSLFYVGKNNKDLAIELTSYF